MERRISTLILLCLALSGVGALNVVIPQEVYEFTQGDNITLPCKFTPKPGSTPPQVTITWSVVAANAEELQIMAYYHPVKLVDIKKRYEGRVSMDVDINTGKANLKLNDITLADNKNFECRVQIPGDDEGKPAANTRLVVLGVGDLDVVIPQEEYEYARGDDITLPCKFTPKPGSTPRLVIISWSVEGVAANAEEFVIATHYHPIGLTDVKRTYEGRASMDIDINTGKANLKLNGITLADNKNFECRVLIPGDDEGKPVANTRLVVLVAPSTPICKIEGKAEYGQNINLTCKSEEGSPAPTYKWDSRDVRKMPQVRDPRTTDKGGVLSLFNISRDTSGYYTCTSTNKIRSASCNITLTVMPSLSGVGALTVVIPQEVYEFAQGDNITLPCTFTPKPGSTPPQVTILWSVEGLAANAEELPIATHYHPIGFTDVTKTYEGRVSMDVDINTGKANLKLNDITLADNKNFECRVLIPGDDDGKPAANTRLVVLGVDTANQLPPSNLVFCVLFSQSVFYFGIY